MWESLLEETPYVVPPNFCAVANWTDGNKEKVRGALRNALIEAGALRDMGSFYMVLVPVLDMDLVQNLLSVDGDAYLKAMGIRV